MKYRQIETKFWEDGYILELTNKEREFFLYLFTNPKVNLCGIYELSDKTIIYTLGYTLGELADFKKKFQMDNKYAFYKGWIYIINFWKYNFFSPAPNILKAFIKEFNLIPSGILNYFFNDLNFPYLLPNIYNNVLSIEKVNVNVNVKVKGVGGRVGGRVGYEARLINEEINLDEISEKI